jgi:hypothetical protein
MNRRLTNAMACDAPSTPNPNCRNAGERASLLAWIRECHARPMSQLAPYRQNHRTRPSLLKRRIFFFFLGGRGVAALEPVSPPVRSFDAKDTRTGDPGSKNRTRRVDQRDPRGMGRPLATAKRMERCADQWNADARANCKAVAELPEWHEATEVENETRIVDRSKRLKISPRLAAALSCRRERGSGPLRKSDSGAT